MNPRRTARLRRLLGGGALLVCALGGMAARPAWGADPEVIQAVRVEGLHTVGEAFVRSRIQSAVGTGLSEAVLDQDVGRLYQTGYFSEVRVRREASGGGVVLVVDLVENPLVVGMKFRGNHAMSDGKLTGLIRSAVKEGETRYLSNADMDLDVKAILAAYREKAYLFARVKARLDPDQTLPSGQLLTFEIEEGAPVPVRKISFKGNRAYSAHQLKKGAPVLTKKKFWFFRAGALDLEILQDDADRIRDFYRAHGWLDASVKASQQIDTDRQRTEITFEVEEGDPYHIGKVFVKTVGLAGGQPLVDATTLLPKFKTASGKSFRLEDVLHDVEKIKEEYGNLGHLVAQAVPRYHYDTVGKAVDVTFEIQEGPLVRIGKVEVEGNEKTRDKIVRRQMTLHPGDRFDYAALKKSVKKIHNLRFFDSIQPRLEEVEDPGTRDLVLEVKEAKTGRFNYGAGYSDEAGVFGVLRISQSNFDSSDLRQFPWNAGKFFLGDAYVGGGQNYFMSATPGQRLTSYDLGYSEPWLYDRPYGLGFNLFLRDRNLVDYQRRDQGASVTLNRRFGEFWTVGSTLATSTVTISGVAVDAPQALQDSQGSTSVNSITPFVRWDTRDDPFTPSSGQSNLISYEYGGGPVLGGVGYWRLSEDYEHFWTLSQDQDEQRKHIVSFSGRTGTVGAHYRTGELPVFLQYFLGGATTVRGFAYNSIAPKDGDTVIGGRFFLLTNVEYTFPVYEEILRGALFVDRGTVEPSIRDGSALSDFRSGYGFGLRVQLPISPAPISLDVGFPLERQTGDSLRLFTFNFGTVF